MSDPNAPIKLSLRRIPVDDNGWDHEGNYRGIGKPLFWYGDKAGTVSGHLRATSRGQAKAQLLETYIQASFWR